MPTEGNYIKANLKKKTFSTLHLTNAFSCSESFPSFSTIITTGYAHPLSLHAM
jgi:hypothetical protein